MEFERLKRISTRTSASMGICNVRHTMESLARDRTGYIQAVTSAEDSIAMDEEADY